MKENKTNRTDLFLIINFICMFVTFWLQIILGILGKLNLFTCLNFFGYSISSFCIFYNVIDKKDPKRTKKIVLTTCFMAIILEIIYLIVLAIRVFIIDLGTGL